MVASSGKEYDDVQMQLSSEVKWGPRLYTVGLDASRSACIRMRGMMSDVIASLVEIAGVCLVPGLPSERPTTCAESLFSLRGCDSTRRLCMILSRLIVWRCLRSQPDYLYILIVSPLGKYLIPDFGQSEPPTRHHISNRPHSRCSTYAAAKPDTPRQSHSPSPHSNSKPAAARRPDKPASPPRHASASAHPGSRQRYTPPTHQARYPHRQAPININQYPSHPPADSIPGKYPGPETAPPPSRRTPRPPAAASTPCSSAARSC